MKEYVADRQRHLRPRTPTVPNFREMPSREGWPAPVIHHGTSGLVFADHWEDEDEYADVVLYVDEIVGRLRKLYEFRDSAAVEAFLEEKPFLIRLLFNAYGKIREYFPPGSRLVLKVVADPEAQEERELFVFIQTKLPPRAARPLLAELDREWWLDAMLDARGQMTIGLEYV
jgi:hypothetical protein